MFCSDLCSTVPSELHTVRALRISVAVPTVLALVFDVPVVFVVSCVIAVMALAPTRPASRDAPFRPRSRVPELSASSGPGASAAALAAPEAPGPENAKGPDLAIGARRRPPSPACLGVYPRACGPSRAKCQVVFGSPGVRAPSRSRDLTRNAKNDLGDARRACCDADGPDGANISEPRAPPAVDLHPLATILSAGSVAIAAFDLFGQAISPPLGRARRSPAPPAQRTVDARFGWNPETKSARQASPPSASTRRDAPLSGRRRPEP